jgi:F0F1-type ATP synthase assembly protein I
MSRGKHKTCPNPKCEGKDPKFKDNHGKGGTYKEDIKKCWICGAPYNEEEYDEWEMIQRMKKENEEISSLQKEDQKRKEGNKMDKNRFSLSFTIISAIVITLIIISKFIGTTPPDVWWILEIIGFSIFIISAVILIILLDLKSENPKKILNITAITGGTIFIVAFIFGLISIGTLLPIKNNTVTTKTEVEETTVAETEETTTIETETTTEVIEETTVEKNFIEIDGETVEIFISTAITTDGKYTLHDSDGNKVIRDLSSAIGFVPDENLLVSDLEPKELGQEPTSITGDWDTYLNTKKDDFGPLAGFTDGTNDYNKYFLHQSKSQIPAYSWMVHTGLYVEIPGIGRIVGGPGRAVMILIINRTDDVYRFKIDPITVIAGFEGWGRIWNGEPREVIETEKRLSNHFLTRLGLGVPEKGFIGQTDQSYENASTVTIVTIERIQWGNNDDGTARYQFRLIRAETVNAMK